MSNVKALRPPENEPELLLQLECADAPVGLKSLQVVKFNPDWGDDRQPAVSKRGPDDKSNSVRMSVRHEVKRSTYRLQMLKNAKIEFSSEAKSPAIVIDADGVALRWRTQFIVPAGRLIDLVKMLDAKQEHVRLTIETLQLDMWGD